jgi:hypothetical protein
MNAERTNPNQRAVVMTDWANTIILGAKQSLHRMDHTLTLTEAKIALIRDLMAKRRELKDRA